MVQLGVLAGDEPARGWTQEREACEHGGEPCEPVFEVQLSDSLGRTLPNEDIAGQQ
jgi:hypothetical protein